VFRPAYLEANGDELSVESDGGKVVDDRFVRIGCVVACRLSGHADPRAGLGKDKRRSRLRNTAAAAPEVREVGGGWWRLGEVVRRGTTSPNLPQPPPTSLVRGGTGSARTGRGRATTPHTRAPGAREA